jgi:hypothetical protein
MSICHRQRFNQYVDERHRGARAGWEPSATLVPTAHGELPEEIQLEAWEFWKHEGTAGKGAEKVGGLGGKEIGGVLGSGSGHRTGRSACACWELEMQRIQMCI